MCDNTVKMKCLVCKTISEVKIKYNISDKYPYLVSALCSNCDNWEEFENKMQSFEAI